MIELMNGYQVKRKEEYWVWRFRKIIVEKDKIKETKKQRNKEKYPK